MSNQQTKDIKIAKNGNSITPFEESTPKKTLLATSLHQLS
jgi:hypothetical protein